MGSRVEEEARRLKPYILGWIKEYAQVTNGVSGASVAPSPHDLSSAHHAGFLANAQAPQFFLKDGTRAMEGNISMPEGGTVDGVDVSALSTAYNSHASDSNRHHTLLSADEHSQYLTNARHDINGRHAMGTVIPTSTTAPTKVSLTASAWGTNAYAAASDHVHQMDVAIVPTWTGSHTFNATMNSSSIIPRTNDTYNLGSTAKLWLKLFVSEIDTFILRENAISVVGGMQFICKSEGVLAAAITAAATTVNFGTAMTQNDIVLLRAGGLVEYMQVGTLVSGTTYNVTRNLDGSGADAWIMGSVWVNLGYNGTGRIELDAYGTPRISIKRQGTAYNTYTEPVRIGDLNGWDSVGTERYGVGIGDFAGGNYLRYDPDGGFKLSGGGGGIDITAAGLILNCQDSGYVNSASVLFRQSGSDLSALSAYRSTSTLKSWTKLETWGVTGDEARTIISSKVGNGIGSYITVADAPTTGIILAPEIGTSLDIQANPNANDLRTSVRMVGKLMLSQIYVQQDFPADLLDGEGYMNLLIPAGNNSSPTTPTSTYVHLWGRNGATYTKDMYGRNNKVGHNTYLAPFIAFPGARYVGSGRLAIDASSTWKSFDLLGTGKMFVPAGTGLGNTGKMAGISDQRYDIFCDLPGTGYLSYPTVGVVSGAGWVCASGWFFLDSTAAAGFFGCGTTTRSWGCYKAAGSSTLVFDYYRTDGALRSFNSSNTVINSGWNFVAVMMNWTSTTDFNVYLYLNGTWTIHSGSTNNPGTVARTPAGEFTVGMWGGVYMDGKLGPFIVGDWTATNCVEDLYNETKGLIAGW